MSSEFHFTNYKDVCSRVLYKNFVVFCCNIFMDHLRLEAGNYDGK